MSRNKKVTNSAIGIRSVSYDKAALIHGFERVVVNLISLKLGAQQIYSKDEKPGAFYFAGTEEQEREIQSFLNSYIPLESARNYKQKYYALLQMFAHVAERVDGIAEQIKEYKEGLQKTSNAISKINGFTSMPIIPNLDSVTCKN